MNCSTIKFICFPQSQLRQSGHKLLIKSLFILFQTQIKFFLFQTQIKQASNWTTLLLLHSQYLSNNMSPMDALNPSGYIHLILMVMIICSTATIPTVYGNFYNDIDVTWGYNNVNRFNNGQDMQLSLNNAFDILILLIFVIVFFFNCNSVMNFSVNTLSYL